MRVKGKRVLKNGAVGGYVYYSHEKKWKWRILGHVSKKKMRGGVTFNENVGVNNGTTQVLRHPNTKVPKIVELKKLTEELSIINYQKFKPLLQDILKNIKKELVKVRRNNKKLIKEKRIAVTIGPIEDLLDKLYMLVQIFGDKLMSENFRIVGQQIINTKRGFGKKMLQSKLDELKVENIVNGVQNVFQEQMIEIEPLLGQNIINSNLEPLL